MRAFPSVFVLQTARAVEGPQRPSPVSVGNDAECQCRHGFERVMHEHSCPEIAYPLMNASSSSLTRSFNVVHIP